MPERVNSFGPPLPAVSFAFILAAAITVPVYSPARADSVCIEQSSQPAPEGTHWSSRYDRARGRKCWFLADASGREVTALPAQPSAAPTPEPTPTLSERLAALFGNSTAAPANAAPQTPVPQISPANAPRKPTGNATNAIKTDNGVRADQKSAGEGPAAKRTTPPMTLAERNALFEDFLRWHESQQGQQSEQSPQAQQSQQSNGTMTPWPSAR
jgi:hypothetical protein